MKSVEGQAAISFGHLVNRRPWRKFLLHAKLLGDVGQENGVRHHDANAKMKPYSNCELTRGLRHKQHGQSACGQRDAHPRWTR